MIVANTAFPKTETPPVWNEYAIAKAIALQTLSRKCVVLVPNCNWTGNECDLLCVTTNLHVIDVEVKISRADLRADAKKNKWWHRTYGPWNAEKHELERIETELTHPKKVWKHYYALPAAIWKPELLDNLPSKASGVLLLRQGGDKFEPNVVVTCERRATPDKNAPRLKPEQVADIARLANLRMWEAYRQRDAAKGGAA